MDDTPHPPIGTSLAAKAGLLLAAVLAVLWLGWDGAPDAPVSRLSADPATHAAAGSGPGHRAPAGPSAPRLDLNQASAKDLTAIPGIGTVLATRIIAHRRRVGPYTSLEELLDIRGIGAGRLAAMRASLTIGAYPRHAPPATTPHPPPEGSRS